MHRLVAEALHFATEMGLRSSQVKVLTGDVGLDVVLALDLNLAPEERMVDDSGDLDAACLARPPTCLTCKAG